ncbi:MAG: peptidoglycan DD-metalloendopeptidase family protein [Cellvibrionaceae bacterium]|nr:peptidoglycan DD-metalloendopeptidase family protein [Cellvibrionaceae bacterium]
MKKVQSTLRGFPVLNLAIAAGLGFALGAVTFNSTDSNAIASVKPSETEPVVAAAKAEPKAPKAEAAISIAKAVAAKPAQVEPQPKPVPQPESEPALASLPELRVEWHAETVKRGDNLSSIFQRAGLDAADVYELTSNSKQAKALRKIHPGQTLDFHIVDGQLQELRYNSSRLTSQHFVRKGDKFTTMESVREPELRPSYHEGTIKSSLFLAGQNAGLSDSLIMEMANIFGWDVDFVLDIRQGDSFKVMFNEKHLDGEHIGNGPILAAEFTNQDKTFKAVRYTHKDGRSHYYTPEGYSMRKEFLRTPVDFARISSHFNLRRKHPVLNRIRAHKGTDYAAPRGTPIRAAGDGKIIHAGRKGGYGKAVILKHGGAYKTLYAHMSKYGKGIRTGKRVKQGQIIGYVGSTGLATGPHLHYEFHVNGRVRNPVTVKLPKAKSIPKKERARFNKETQPMLAQMGDLQAARVLAGLEKPRNTL